MKVMKCHTSYLHNIFMPEKFKDCITDAKKTLKNEKFDVLVVTGNSGTLFGGALAIALNKPVILIRKEEIPKAHSLYEIEGTSDGKTWIFVDDFIESGSTLKKVCEKMRNSELFNHMKLVGVYQYKYDLFHKPDIYKHLRLS